MGGAKGYFLKKSLGPEIFMSIVSWAANFVFEKFVKLNVLSLSNKKGKSRSQLKVLFYIVFHCENFASFCKIDILHKQLPRLLYFTK